jgi:hypothetical protein
MSRARLYVDEDAADCIVVDGLVRAGFDVLTAIEAGNRRLPDEGQLSFAIGDSRAIYSLNASDFFRLHTETLDSGRGHFGIVVFASQRYGAGEKVRRLRELLEHTTAEEMVDQMYFL